MALTSSPSHPSSRLVIVADAANIQTGSQLCVADIGCYVGHLTMRLVQQGARVIATDICSGPLELARQKAEEVLSAEEQSRLEFRLGNGFSPFREDELQVACLVGLPAGLLLKLLPTTPSSVRRLVLQPTCPTGAEAMMALRCWLRERHWHLIEHICLERGGVCLTLVADLERPHDHSLSQDICRSEKAQLLPWTVREHVHQQLLKGIEDDDTRAYAELLQEYLERMSISHRVEWMAQVLEEEVEIFKKLKTGGKSL